MQQPVAVVLAAGLGTRMKSKKAKVLHEIVGIPMIQHVINTLRQARIENIILVLGYQGEIVTEYVGNRYEVVYQKEQLGTGHALLQALPLLQALDNDGECLVVCGDTPLLKAGTIEKLREVHNQSGASATILTANLADPTGYGRIIKNSLGVEKIVEEKDASLEEKRVCEINTGTYCFDIKELRERLKKLNPANAQGEYYLTDVITLLSEDGKKVETLLLEDFQEAKGINNRVQLAEAERIFRQRILEEKMLQGVTIIDPGSTYIGAKVVVARDTIIYPGVILDGSTIIEEDCIIGPCTRIIDSTVGQAAQIQYSCLLKAKVGKRCVIGPYSYLRPGTDLAEDVKIGDFAEVKNSIVGAGSKIPHLSYVGDSQLGKNVNIGAGTITCNYDGKNKNKTEIGDGAFIGSNTNLVAPITIGAGVYVGAGSTLTKDVPEGTLAVARSKQRNIERWKRTQTEDTDRDNNKED